MSGGHAAAPPSTSMTRTAQNAVVASWSSAAATALSGAKSTGSGLVTFLPPRTFWRALNVGSLRVPPAAAANPTAKAFSTRCWPARNEVEM